jgi:MYXO-CTERM domain-containing protein
MVGGPYSLGIHSVAQVCNPIFCPVGPFGTCCNPDGTCGTPGPTGACGHFDGGLDPTSNCIANAKARGDTLCMQGTYCACSACPSQEDTCAIEKGCLDILGCMAKFDCTDLDCYTPERCASIIDTYGGPKSLPYFDATSLAACDRASGCRLDCTDQPPIGMGGAGSSATGGKGNPPPVSGGSSGFAGSSGTGGRTGSGGIQQLDGGLDTIKKGATSGGCGCSVPKERTSGWAALAAMACLGLAVGRRKRR